MNMFLHELKANRKSTIIWTCSLSAIIILFLSLYPSFSKDIDLSKKLIEGLPESVRKIFGISLDTFSSVVGFYAYIFLYIRLSGAIQAMNLGTSILSKEVREKTADFLLTKPVSRKKVVTAKILAALTSLIITDAVFMMVAGVMASIASTGQFSLKIFLMISFTLFFVQLFFLSLGVVISVILPKIRSVLPISLGTVFGFFALNMFGSVIGDQAIRYIVPFLYYDSPYIMKNASYETSFVITEIVFIVVAIAVSYMIYLKKDIHAV